MIPTSTGMGPEMDEFSIYPLESASLEYTAAVDAILVTLFPKSTLGDRLIAISRINAVPPF